MSLYHASASPVCADDAHLERVYRALLDVFEIPEPSPFDYASLDPELLPPDAPRLPCGCGCGDTLVRIDEAAQGFCLGHAGPEERVAADDEDRSRRRVERGPDADEEAWHSGWTLGYSGIEADAPSGLSGHQRRAFLSGLDAGWKQLEHEDRLAWAEKWDREMIALMMADQDIESRYENAELAEIGLMRKAI